MGGVKVSLSTNIVGPAIVKFTVTIVGEIWSLNQSGVFVVGPSRAKYLEEAASLREPHESHPARQGYLAVLGQGRKV